MSLSPEALLRDEAQVRARLITNLVYEIDLDLTKGDDTFGSTTTIRFVCTEPGADTFIDLTAKSVHQITLNGEALDPSIATGYRIPLAGLKASNELVIDADCLYSRSGQGLHWFKDPTDDEVYLYSQFEPRNAHRAYACFDQPDLKGTFQFTVTTPDHWLVRSNTVASVSEEGGKRVHGFPATQQMSAYITAIVAGPYAEWKDQHADIELGFYCRQSLAKYFEPDIAELVDVTRRGFDFFNEYFGVEYPWGKYDQLMVPEFNAGAMENAACVTFNETYIFRSKVIDERRERRAETILHEMAHMWFGDLVTMKWWDDLWLNESFATYMASLSMVEATRWTGYWERFASAYKAWAMRQDQLPTTHPIVADCPDTETAMTNFDGISYAKGASVLKQLVAFVGAENFKKGCRLYMQRHAFGNATLAEFLGCQEETSGRDLKAWAAEWLETAGVNTLRPVIDGDDQITSFKIEQTAAETHPTIRTHRLRVGAYDASGSSLELREKIELDVTGVSTVVPQLVGAARPDFVLVNDDDLTFAKVRLDDRSLQTARDNLRGLSDPLSRAIVWAAAIDQLTTVELAARDFVSLIVNNIGAETDSGLVSQMLAVLGAAITMYGDPANREPARLALATLALEEAKKAEAGSDLQLVWARTFINNARTSEHVALVRALLDGTETIEGLAIDTDVRWSIVGSLAGLGAIDDRVIEAELKRDPTDEGQRRAATAYAARPTSAAKEAAWEKITDTETSMQLKASYGAGFWRFDQAELLAPFEDRYFEFLPVAWERGPVEVAVNFVTTFPMSQLRPELVERVEAYLRDNPDTAPPFARYLTEFADQMTRALRARELDAKAGSDQA
ncbi:MAG: aminopeptidase N [Actinomycetota bacterium]